MDFLHLEKQNKRLTQIFQTQMKKSLMTHEEQQPEMLILQGIWIKI